MASCRSRYPASCPRNHDLQTYPAADQLAIPRPRATARQRFRLACAPAREFRQPRYVQANSLTASGRSPPGVLGLQETARHRLQAQLARSLQRRRRGQEEEIQHAVEIHVPRLRRECLGQARRAAGLHRLRGGDGGGGSASGLSRRLTACCTIQELCDAA